MNINEFALTDKKFNEATFLTKVNNIFIKYFTAIMLDKLVDVDHFISDDIYEYTDKLLSNLRNNKQRQMYDELNVKTSRINKIEVTDSEYIIEVYLEARYMDYVLDLNTGNKISGNDTSRIQVNYMLKFIKRRDTNLQSVARICPNCRASINVNNSGKCEYCGSIYNQEDYDWVLADFIVS